MKLYDMRDGCVWLLSANMSTLINWAKVRGNWDFFSKSNLLVLIGCLEDSTNEVNLNEYTLTFKSLGSLS